MTIEQINSAIEKINSSIAVRESNIDLLRRQIYDLEMRLSVAEDDMMTLCDARDALRTAAYKELADIEIEE